MVSLQCIRIVCRVYRRMCMDLLQSSTNALPVISKVHVTRQKILSYLA